MPLKNGKEFILIFDIETVPDTDAANNLLDSQYNSYDEKVKALKEYHLHITNGKNEFLRQLFHKVIAISSVIIQRIPNGGFEEDTYKFIKVGTFGNEDSSEEELINHFFSYIEEHTPMLVSFNGRTFDLPVLRYRAMKYHIQCPVFYTFGDSNFKKGGYTNRYNNNLHLDLLDALSDFGSSARIKLNEICSILNIPGKLGMDGSKVEENFLNGEIEKIRNYCETDVLNTWFVYLKYILNHGKIDIQNYLKLKEQTLDFLFKQNKNHLKEFYEAYKQLND